MTRDERNKLDENLNHVLKFIIENIPRNWDIVIRAYHDECSMELENPEGDEVSSDWDGDDHAVYHLVNHAREAEGMEPA